ncbi:hypothetical protein D3C85_1696140 [compost metagenome]
MSQKIISLIVWFEIETKNDTNAPRNACITTPDRISVSIFSFPSIIASFKTKNREISPVTKATIGIDHCPNQANCSPK